MSTAETERPGWSCAWDETGVIIYSILVPFLTLSWAYIPHLAAFRGMSAQIRFRVRPAERTRMPIAKPVPRPESLLAALPTELSHSLFVKARSVSLAASQTLFVAGDEGDGCYRVEEGLLKASIAAPAGGERILAILGPGSVVGELSMIDGGPRSASVTALRDSKLGFVGRTAFEAFGRSQPELYRHVAMLLAQRLRDTDDALVATNFLSVKGRVARALLSLAEAFGRDLGQGRILIRQKVSQSDLAAMAGIARENVSRVLNDWVHRSLVSRLAGYYCLEKKAVLEREAEG
jgi:CRP/FNR family cyclic AMP-dependent transcriptional regulator